MFKSIRPSLDAYLIYPFTLTPTNLPLYSSHPLSSPSTYTLRTSHPMTPVSSHILVNLSPVSRTIRTDGRPVRRTYENKPTLGLTSDPLGSLSPHHHPPQDTKRIKHLQSPSSSSSSSPTNGSNIAIIMTASVVPSLPAATAGDSLMRFTYVNLM